MVLLQIIFILFCLVLLLVMWILLAPLVVHIDTGSGTYFVELVTLARARLLLPGEDLFKIRMRVFFVHFTIDPFRSRKKKKKKEKTGPERKKPERKKRISIRSGKKFVGEMMRSFDAELIGEIDTGDVIINAWLVPAFIFLNSEGFRVSVNNNGINTIRVKLCNRLITMLYLFIKFRMRNR